jgi:hypothetical protein
MEGAAGGIEPALVPARRMTQMEEWLLDKSVDVVERLAREMGLSRAEAFALVADRIAAPRRTPEVIEEVA